ncbi:MAG: site-2 protease family protein [Phycisphaeraceae bacterium]|nr:site-2 protease family protein [Phycisphaeraceae bacterium]
MFFQYALEPDGRLYFVSWVLTVILSISLHELAHGLAALRLGDDTPRLSGHMTLDPLVHLGPFSILTLLILGLAWGQMPVNPSRLRGRYAHALVAVAGPATNLLLAFLTLTILGFWLRRAPDLEEASLAQSNFRQVVWIFGTANIVLCLFNLLPVPPLDGSHILADFHPGYARLISDPDRQQIMFFAMAGAFVIGGSFFQFANTWAQAYINWLGQL